MKIVFLILFFYLLFLMISQSDFFINYEIKLSINGAGLVLIAC